MYAEQQKQQGFGAIAGANLASARFAPFAPEPQTGDVREIEREIRGISKSVEDLQGVVATLEARMDLAGVLIPQPVPIAGNAPEPVAPMATALGSRLHVISHETDTIRKRLEKLLHALEL